MCISHPNACTVFFVTLIEGPSARARPKQPETKKNWTHWVCRATCTIHANLPTLSSNHFVEITQNKVCFDKYFAICFWPETILFHAVGIPGFLRKNFVWKTWMSNYCVKAASLFSYIHEHRVCCQFSGA